MQSLRRLTIHRTITILQNRPRHLLPCRCLTISVLTTTPSLLRRPRRNAISTDELAGTENRIATERRRYNEVVQAYNTRIKTFPTLVTARMFGFEPEKYFEAPEEAQKVPPVKF